MAVASLLAVLLVLTPSSCPKCGQMSGEVEVRGFLRRGPGELLYLCEDPGVRSCCLGQGGEALLVEGLLLSELPQGAVTLKGQIQGDRLTQVRLEKGNYALPGSLTLIGALVLVGGNVARVLRRKRRSRRSA